MNRQHQSKPLDIPVKVVHDGPPEDTTAAAVLHEVKRMLETLLSTGAENSMDLSHSPLAPQAYQQLKNTLGQGEVTADITSLGRTTIRETAVPGVWWITHISDDERVLGEFLEVTACPHLLKSQPEDLELAITRLQERGSRQPAAPPDREAVARRVAQLGLSPQSSRSDSGRPAGTTVDTGE